MEEAFRILKPLNRTNSLPSSLTDPAYDFELPPALQDTLDAPRQTFSLYRNGITPCGGEKKTIEANAPKSEEGQKNKEISAAEPLKFHHASPPHSIDDEDCRETKTDSVLPIDSHGLNCPQQGTHTSPLSTVAKPQAPEVVSPHHHGVNVMSSKVASGDVKPTNGGDGSPGLSLQSDTPPPPESRPTPVIPLPLEQVPVGGGVVDAKKETGKEVRTPAQQLQAPEEATNQKALPTLTSTELCVAYDPHQMVDWMIKYRNCRLHCPAGIAEFIKKHNFSEANAGTANLAGRSRPQTRPIPGTHSTSCLKMSSPFGVDNAFGAKRQGELDGKAGPVGALGSSPPLSASLSSSFDYHSGGHYSRSGSLFDKEAIPSGQTALQAMESLWEDRRAIPIAVAAPLRRRGLFGVAAKKEIQHMVLSVLNKVTTDVEKFQEVKKELLRLPIPEANAEQLDTIVDVFFKKAVREQHFSRAYAELMAALCKVPQGQHITGDKTLSPEYRMRRALLPRCQKMFLSGAQTDKNEGSVIDEDELTEKRRVMTGNIRFVSELFLCGIIPETIIAFIFLTCCTGSEYGTFTVPPTHIPTEVEVDEIIAVTGVVGALFFTQTKKGRELLPQLLYTLQYWSEHHTVTRCKYLLMHEVEKLSEWLSQMGVELPSVSTPPASQGLLLASQTLQNLTPMIRQQSLEARSPVSGGGLESENLSPKDKPSIKPCEPPISRSNTGQSSCSASGVFPNTPVSAPRSVIHQGANKTAMVGSRPIPAPRSSQNKASLGVYSSPTTEDSLSLASANLQPQQQRVPTSVANVVAVPTFPQTHTRSIPRVEAIAKDMAQLKSGVVKMSDMLDAWMVTYDDVLPILAIWTDRCLSVVREEANRLATGELLSLVLHRNESCRQRSQLRELIFDGLERALNARLHEDLKLFRFWAQTVLSDSRRVVLDEELLECGLEYLLEYRPGAVQSYLVDVGQWYGYVQSGENHLIASDESNAFLRYRPLLCQEISHGGTGRPAVEKPRMEEFVDVRHSSLEFDVYYTLTHGSPPSIESLFEKLRTSPRLRVDYTLVAEVLSAILLAEINSPENRDYLKSCIPLLQIAVDGPNRRERELALIAEVHEVYDAFRQRTPQQSQSAKSHILGKLRSSHVVSDESLDRVARFFAERDEHDGELSEVDSAHVTRAPKQIGAAVVVPEKPPLVNTPQHTWMGGGLGDSLPAHRKVSSAHSGGHSIDRQFYPLNVSQPTDEGGANRTAYNIPGHRGGGGMMDAMTSSMPYPMPPHLASGPNFNNAPWMQCMGTSQHQVQQYYRSAGRHNQDAGAYHPRNHHRGGGGYDDGRDADAGGTGGANKRRERRAWGRGGRNRGN